MYALDYNTSWSDITWQYTANCENIQDWFIGHSIQMVIWGYISVSAITLTDN